MKGADNNAPPPQQPTITKKELLLEHRKTQPCGKWFCDMFLAKEKYLLR